MPSLQVRELPDNIYQLLQKKANDEHRSLSQEAIVVLAKGLNTSISHKSRRKKLLESIAENTCSNINITQLDPVDLIREDRNR
jgi:plasmid stability protein